MDPAAEKAIWEAIDELRNARREHSVKHAELEGAVTLVGEQLMHHGERTELIHKQLSDQLTTFSAQFNSINNKLDLVRTEVAEKRGAARFGMWVVGTLISLGVPAALFSWYTSNANGGGPP